MDAEILELFEVNTQRSRAVGCARWGSSDDLRADPRVRAAYVPSGSSST